MSFDSIDTTDFEKRLKKLGLKYSGEDNSNGHSVAYHGAAKGYEDIGEFNVVITDNGDRTEICWAIHTVDGDDPGVPILDVPFGEEDFGYGNVYDSIGGTRELVRVGRELYDACYRYMKKTKCLGSGKDPSKVIYSYGFAIGIDEYMEGYFDYGIANLEDFVRDYDVPGYYNSYINNDDMQFYNALIHYMTTYYPEYQDGTWYRPNTWPYEAHILVLYMPGIGPCLVENGELKPL